MLESSAFGAEASHDLDAVSSFNADLQRVLAETQARVGQVGMTQDGAIDAPSAEAFLARRGAQERFDDVLKLLATPGDTVELSGQRKGEDDGMPEALSEDEMHGIAREALAALDVPQFIRYWTFDETIETRELDEHGEKKTETRPGMCEPDESSSVKVISVLPRKKDLVVQFPFGLLDVSLLPVDCSTLSEEARKKVVCQEARPGLPLQEDVMKRDWKPRTQWLVDHVLVPGQDIVLGAQQYHCAAQAAQKAEQLNKTLRIFLDWYLRSLRAVVEAAHPELEFSELGTERSDLGLEQKTCANDKECTDPARPHCIAEGIASPSVCVQNPVDGGLHAMTSWVGVLAGAPAFAAEKACPANKDGSRIFADLLLSKTEGTRIVDLKKIALSPDERKSIPRLARTAGVDVSSSREEDLSSEAMAYIEAARTARSLHMRIQQQIQRIYSYPGTVDPKAGGGAGPQAETRRDALA